MSFGIFSIPKEPSVILTLVIHYVLGPEQGPSVDCLSTSPKAALGNEWKQKKTAASIVHLNIHLYRECMTGKRCGMVILNISVHELAEISEFILQLLLNRVLLLRN